MREEFRFTALSLDARGSWLKSNRERAALMRPAGCASTKAGCYFSGSRSVTRSWNQSRM